MNPQEKCFACGRPLQSCCLVDTRDGQEVYVGPECYRKVIHAGQDGYQPPQGGPKLYPINDMEVIKRNNANEIEQRARDVGNNRTALRKRLNEARSVLVNRRQFGKGKLDFENRRLIGDNGLALQWLLRPEPDQPPSYRNQQTNIGTVIITCPQ